MSSLNESEKLGEADFSWGEKGGVGGKNKKVQFYRSFTYDGVDYALYDCVYMYKEGEPAPYIGKLVKLWENFDKSKRVKVQWFFRPSEISYYLKDAKVLENELFFASGEGTGLANLNPLEAIAGKCNVVCISTDSRNPQPSAEELQMADYVFYRIFDVKSFIISDQLDDKVGGLEVKYVFNNTLDGPKLDSNDKNDERNVVASKETLKPAGKNSIQQLNNVQLDKNSDHTREEEDTNKMLVPLKQGSLLEKHSSGVDVISSKDGVTTGTTMEGRGILGAKNVGCNVSGEKDEFKDMESPVTKLQVEEGVKSARKFCNLDNAPSKRAKYDGTVPGNEAAHLVTSAATSVKDKTLTSNVASCDETLRPTTTIVSPNETPKSGSNKDFEGSRQAAKLTQSSTTSTKKTLKRSADLSKEKSNPGHVISHENKDKKLASNSCPMEERSLKKAKLDDTIKQSEDNMDNNIKKLKEKDCDGETKLTPKLVMPCDNTTKSRLGEATLKDHRNEKDDKLSSDKLPNPLTSRSKGGGEVGGQVIEVTRRPIEKSTWIKLPWEEKMKTAHDERRLVMLHNLDPKYTSGEVEDIIYHVFDEKCTAKMVPQTAISSPRTGQALVVFGTREAANKVLQKLDDGCLMLPNRRPLVGSLGVLPKSEKQTTFVGHLAIDKARRQIQREIKEAVATSHYSQNNTIEYEMSMEWCLLQSRSDVWWKMLHETHKQEITKLEGNLKHNPKLKK